ncbi:MAG: hypothetical protein HOP20_07115 [Sulfuriferula sp.]|nr:hypothetical protein [Sulfuriferula sp.]
MAKLLLLLLVGGALYWWWRKPAPRQTKPRVKPTENMVRCAHCGVHLPQSEAVSGTGVWFCSALHHDEFSARQ